MRSPIIPRASRSAAGKSASDPRHGERGVTIALVAAAMVGMISMAALSIDIGTFYQARAEAQRTADAAALAAARVISLSGMTGDPSNATGSWGPTCGGSTSAATSAAMAIAKVQQNFIGNVTPSTINVNYGAGGGVASCSGLVGTSFAVNPIITVTVQRTGLPIFFGHVFSLVGSTYSSTSVSATAAAEVFNPSGSDTYAAGGVTVPVQPRCVKPWIVPNKDPGNIPNPFVSLADGSIITAGVEVSGAPPGEVGESFTLSPDCGGTPPGTCTPLINPTPQATTGNLQYLPGLVSYTIQAQATPTCATGASGNSPYYQSAIAGCDQSTAYQCGVQAASASTPDELDLTENPKGSAGDTATAVQCLIHEASESSAPSGQDTLQTTSVPYQILAGSSNPVNLSGNAISSSNSVVSLPIYDSTAAIGTGPNPNVTIVGFLQVFVNYVDAAGNPNVTVLNVAGCGNNVLATATSVNGTSPVPIRLITPP